MPDLSRTTRELDAMYSRARAAFESKDLAAYRDVFSPELKYHQLDGRTISRDRLMRDVSAQFRRCREVQSSYIREHLEVTGDRATETLTQTGSFSVSAFLILHRTWHLFRKGRYTWKRLDGRWVIDEVDVLEEKVIASPFQFGLRPPPETWPTHPPLAGTPRRARSQTRHSCYWIDLLLTSAPLDRLQSYGAPHIRCSGLSAAAP